MSVANMEITEGGASGNVKNIFSLLWQTAISITCAWLLSFYLLPNTLFATSSPLSKLTCLSVGHSTFISVLAIAVCSIAVWLLYLQIAKLSMQTLALWLVTGCWLTAIIFGVLQWHKNVDASSASAAVLASLAIGLFSARLIGKPFSIVLVFLLLAAGQAAYCLSYQHDHIHDVVIGSVERQRGTFVGQTAIGTIMVLALPFAIGCLVRENDSPYLVPGIVLTAAISTALWATWSPISICAAGSGLVLLLWRYTARMSYILLLTGGLAVATCYVWHADQSYSNMGVNIQRPPIETLPKWSHGATVFASNSAEGLGIGALRVEVPDSSGSRGEVVNLEPGNILLQWLDEMGVAGAILLFLFFAAISQCLRKNTSELSYPLGAAWLALLVLGVFRTPFGTISTLHGNVIVGLLLGITMLDRSKESSSKSLNKEEIL